MEPKLLSQALGMVAVNASEQTCDLIMAVLKELETSDDLLLSKAIEIKSANLAKYAAEAPVEPHEVEPEAKEVAKPNERQDS